MFEMSFNFHIIYMYITGTALLLVADPVSYSYHMLKNHYLANDEFYVILLNCSKDICFCHTCKLLKHVTSDDKG